MKPGSSQIKKCISQEQLNGDEFLLNEEYSPSSHLYLTPTRERMNSVSIKCKKNSDEEPVSEKSEDELGEDGKLAKLISFSDQFIKPELMKKPEDIFERSSISDIYKRSESESENVEETQEALAKEVIPGEIKILRLDSERSL
jgi:hypothetical protein